jgi:F-type H+-transporting ATPase subunit c
VKPEIPAEFYVQVQQNATGKATEAISRQPEASGKIQTNLLLGAALAEGTAIFGFVVALLIILFLG